MSDTHYRIIEENKQYTGYVEVRQVLFEAEGPNGKLAAPTTNTVVNGKNGIIAVLYDPFKDMVLLTDEFRIATLVRDETAWNQIALDQRPTGRLLGCILGAAKPGEKFEDVARREAQEESHVEVNRAFVGPTFFSAGSIMPNFVTAYTLEFDSTKVTNGATAGLVEEEGENISVRLLSLEELNEVLDETSLSRTMDAPSQAAVSWFLRKQPLIKAQWTGGNVATLAATPVIPESRQPPASVPAPIG